MSMNSEDQVVGDARSPVGVDAAFAALIKPLLRRVHAGRITIHTPRGARLVHEGAGAGPEASIVIHRWRALRRLMLAGDVGFAEAYMDGDWTTTDLTAVIQLVAENYAALESAIGGSLFARSFNRLRHLARANTKRGSRRNIVAHYDLGNAFYSHWLDESMTYSSALYGVDANGAQRQTLEEAQAAKLARIRDLLDLSPGERVLEIGCGWGALARMLARDAGANVTGLTLSPSQLAFAQERNAQEGLSGAIDLRLQDYRDVGGVYDRIVSIEMIEAVGERYWPNYFGAIRDRLKTGGCALLQVITIADDRYADYSRAPDFIQRYIFPGGMLPSKAGMRASAAAAGLEIVSSETFGESYAITLAEWRHRFHLAWPRIAELGFDQRFRKLWDYYLCYCEAGFRAGTIDVGLYKLAHARS